MPRIECLDRSGGSAFFQSTSGALALYPPWHTVFAPARPAVQTTCARYGTLNYSKQEGQRASIMLPLCDVSKVERLEIEEHGPYCFVISCPPALLTLKANNNDEVQEWIQAIAHHAALWKSKSQGR